MRLRSSERSNVNLQLLLFLINNNEEPVNRMAGSFLINIE